MTQRYAVIGHPIAHSKSPQIHRAFAEQTGEDIEYGRILGDLDDFAGDVAQFFRAGGQGLNVTVPFKEAAFRLADWCSPLAESAKAVNTLWQDERGRLCGANTDGIGLVRDLEQNHGYDWQGKAVLLLGAGGASRGVLRPLLETGVAWVCVANRTPSKAQQLAVEMAPWGHVDGCGLDALPGRRFDLIINGTAAGLSGQVPAIPNDCLRPGGWTYDMMYASTPTAFVLWGQAHGAAKALDGLGMLVEQAAESFYLWRGVRPQTHQVIEHLRNT